MSFRRNDVDGEMRTKKEILRQPIPASVEFLHSILRILKGGPPVGGERKQRCDGELMVSQLGSEHRAGTSLPQHFRDSMALFLQPTIKK